ncbi:chromosome segregation protein SMC [Desulfosporosinus sp. PR]|uniref:chromosome segregation protein SMC n=1 Tax=Candidatus Desulfosporosinus nitrosoreducens TaxID=3401928 RepID=UPI0027FCFC4C|nr:chromosome segregation protein SMC [Desulfosporosinus sp. PR]MDQ7094716.1 chromosome segregation protein SMC [Desulfosporosinus sp. PR]
MSPENFPVFLKEIQIQGFKSFADRVKLELGHGLSVIVGPNGSGKSNVADAVRWVLGEQSAKSLRGSKMEDVIFAGSTQRRQVGMAEVSLIFDNESGIFPLDFREVTITRRVYRDGEGQYLINKASCRLKDIQELFMDTGAGKEGFSIIGQGRVEEILNLKSEERRSLIEETAGITKYRYRKREALKRLDATNTNLQRLGDIIQEIEGQLVPLAAQAQAAERSLALMAEQKSLEIQTIVLDVSEVKQKLAAATQESETAQLDLIEAQTILRQIESRDQKLKVELKTLDEEIQSKQGEAFQAEQACNALKHEQSLRLERSKYFQEQIERLVQEISEGEEKLHQLEQRLKTLAAKQAVLTLTVEESRQKVAEQELKLADARDNKLAEDIERLKADLFQAMSVQANCSNELTGKRHSLASLEQQLLQVQQEQEKKQRELQMMREAQETQERDLAELQDQAQVLQDEGDRLRPELDKLKGLRQEKSAQLQQQRRKTDQTRARLQALQTLEDSLEGYQRGVREVMLAKKKGIREGSGLCGTVADLISVPENYEIAIETALGAGLQNVVAENELSAKAAISYLKAHQFGRVTFLPLDVIQGNKMTVSKVVASDPGFMGIAVDLVEYERQYQAAMEFLLGRIVVVTDMDAATRIARASGYKLRIVTLEGDQVHPGGSLSGGSIQRKGGNLLARAREIETLRSELARLETDFQEQEREALELEKLERDLRQNLEILMQRQHEAKNRQVMLKAAYDNSLNQTRRLEGDLRGLGQRNQGTVGEIDEITLALKNSVKQFEAAEKTSRELREEFNRREQEAKTTAEEIELCREQLTKEKVSLAKWEQELTQCAEQLEQDTAVRRDYELSLKQKRQNLVNLQKNRQTVDEEQLKLRQNLEEHTKLQEASQYSLMTRRQEREDLSAKIQELEQEIQVQTQKVHGLEQRLHANDLRIVRWETESQTGLVRLAEEFSLEWGDALTYLTQEERSVIGKRAQDLKRQIEAFGPINQAAIEEYPKLCERHEFMLAQQKDLVEADQTLRQLIDELDQTMSERFLESFNAVNAAFKEVFKELFNGGNAELSLVEPDQLLETGVEIVAQPPGKKPQLLSLLSGGERALTAIALLFALLRIKPSPFCILDEIEASLDDANVQRFAQYLHRLSGSTQFVVISHRKGTMESADVLYGITMEESGVSKLLSVRLHEREEGLA